MMKDVEVEKSSEDFLVITVIFWFIQLKIDIFKGGIPIIFFKANKKAKKP